MDPNITRFAEMAAIFLATCAGVAAIITVLGIATRLVQRALPTSRAPQFDETRQQRLEQAVDAIAVEVERISESQRFMSRLMNERSHEASIPPR